MKKVLWIFLVFLFLFVFVYFIFDKPAKNTSLKPQKPIVFVSILPQKFIVKKIAGDFLSVFVMVQPKFSPATYSPTPKQMNLLTKADLFFGIGVPFEKSWLPKIASQNPNLEVIDVSKNIKKRAVDTFLNRKKQKEDDPHIWLSLKLMKQQSRFILKVLSEKYPDKKSYFEENEKKLEKEFDKVELSVKNLFKNVKNREFLVFHPSFGYFADEFGLKQIPVESEGKLPGGKLMSEIIKYAKSHKIKTVVIQQQFAKRPAQVIADSVGGKILQLNPLSEDYIKNIKLMAKKLSEALNEQSN